MKVLFVYCNSKYRLKKIKSQGCYKNNYEFQGDNQIKIDIKQKVQVWFESTHAKIKDIKRRRKTNQNIRDKMVQTTEIFCKIKQKSQTHW